MKCHYLNLGSASVSDWLKQISNNQKKQKHYPDVGSNASSVWNFCARSSESFRGQRSGDVLKCRPFPQAKVVFAAVQLDYNLLKKRINFL